MNKVIAITMAVALAAANALSADAAFGAPFTSHAVLQRDCKLPIWGSADADTKIAVTLDAGLFERLEECGNVTDEILLRAVMLKRKTVMEDEKEETGARRVLNFGHTLGHGIEIAAGGRLLHGEAVALGMLPMAAGPTRSRLLALCRRLGLPESFDYDPEAALRAMLHDKKAGKNGVACVTVGEPGEYAFLTLDENGLKRLAYGEAIRS